MRPQYRAAAASRPNAAERMNKSGTETRFRPRSLAMPPRSGSAVTARAGMLGAPLRAGAAHVVLLGAIAVEQVGGHGAPQVSDGLADARCFVLAGHDTFPSSRRVPTAGSAFWSRRMSAWFSGHDAAELVKIRYNFACVVFPICESLFPKFYRHRRHIRACGELRCDAGHVSAEELCSRGRDRA